MYTKFFLVLIFLGIMILKDMIILRSSMKKSEQIGQLKNDVARYHNLFFNLENMLNCSEKSCLDEAAELKVMLDDTLFIVGCDDDDDDTSSSNRLACLTEKKKSDFMKKKKFDETTKLQLISKANVKVAAISDSQGFDVKKLMGAATAVDGQKVVLLDQFKPRAMWKKSFPKLNVVGEGKAGTSQLYQILADHADVSPAGPRKEFCCRCNSQDMGDPKTQKCMYGCRQKLHRKYSKVPGNHLTVNGCIKTEELILHYRYLPPTGAKFFFLFRDPADLLWAAWNFWYHDMDTEKRNSWTYPNLHYRTPELFHELVASGGKLQYAMALYSRITRITQRARLTLQLVGRDNILFLRNEDMEPSQIVQTSFLTKLSNFTGLDDNKFNPTSILKRVNCNDVKGWKTECKNLTLDDRGTYRISGSRKMLEETRSLIYLLFKDECIVWAHEFGIEYPDCANVGIN